MQPMQRSIFVSAVIGTVLAAAPLAAQGRGHDRDRDDRGYDNRGYNSDSRVPPGQMPPAGMCRVWIDGVPPGRQPAPTDCATAERNVPRNGRVIYGGSANGRGNGKWKKDRDDRDDDRYERSGRDRDNGGYGRGQQGNAPVYSQPPVYGQPAPYPNPQPTTTPNNNDGCYDTNHDGWCDKDPKLPAKPSDICPDRDHNGRCDTYEQSTYGTYPQGSPRSYPQGYPQSGYPQNTGRAANMPLMRDVVQFNQGRYPDELRRWVGNDVTYGTAYDTNRDGVVDQIDWQVGNRLVQRWLDLNRDGRADLIQYFDASGRLVREVR